MKLTLEKTMLKYSAKKWKNNLVNYVAKFKPGKGKNLRRTKTTLLCVTVTLSPISETNINEKAAVKPDFAIAAKIDEGPPFTNAISEYTKAHPNSTEAIERRYVIRLGGCPLQNHRICISVWTQRRRKIIVQNFF